MALFIFIIIIQHFMLLLSEDVEMCRHHDDQKSNRMSSEKFVKQEIVIKLNFTKSSLFHLYINMTY